MHKTTLMIGLAALLATACGDTTTATPDAAQEAAAQAAKEAEEAAAKEAKEAEMAAAAAKNTMAAVAIDDLIAGRDEKLGKTIIVSGLYGSQEPHEEMTHVTLVASPDEGAASVLCAMADAAALEGVEANAEIYVKGTVADHDGALVLESCGRAEPPPPVEAPADDADDMGEMDEDEGQE